MGTERQYYEEFIKQEVKPAMELGNNTTWLGDYRSSANSILPSVKN